MRNFLISIIAILLFPIYASSYETNVHYRISDNAINNSIIQSFLKNNLNISLDDYFDNKSGREWIRQGSVWEDDDITMRWLNHFYDPTTGLGLHGIVSGKPSLQWAKDYANNEWDSNKAKSYYYSALTSTIKADREKNFAKVFRALGQLIHLVEDKAVPAHVRNDAHPYYFENYLQQQRDMYEKYTRDAVNDELNGTNRIPHLKYDGYSAVDITTFNSLDTFWINSGKGLSEFTNRNFVSRDTNFDDPAYSTYNTPASIGEGITTERVYDLDYGWIYVNVKYLQGYATDNYRSGQSSPINRLSAFSYFDYEANKYLGKNVYSFNNYVHKEYADLLIPRAVGYSAGLLNYFFRGSIGMERDQNAPDELVVMNLSAEQMNGSFGLYYDDATDYRRSIGSWGLEIPAYSPKYAPLSYCTLKDLKPEPKEKGKYILAFQGTMGNETGAVVANANIDLLASSCEKALTISGPDTAAQDTSTQLEVSGCTGCADDLAWTASGKGATIDKNGLLTVDKTACGGTATVTAKCPDCKTEITKTITIPDPIKISDPDISNCYTATGGTGSYTWDISKGSIDSNGCIIATTGQCGITTITLTDANGCKTTKTVTLPDTLTITGPDAPVDGDCYTVTGGTEPYTWDITKGKIDATKGCVKELTDLCGPATIKAKDVNECTGKKDVNIPARPLTVSGSDAIAKNSSETYSAGGCSKAVNWSVTGKGAAIEPLENTGALLKTDETACSTITVTAKCPDCNTEASKNVSVSDTCGTLTISGPDTTLKSNTAQYTMDGNCCGDDQVWSVTGTGASISQTGLLTTSSACGSLKVKASCPSCGTEAEKDVRVSDAGQWVQISSCGRGGGHFHESCETITGKYKRRIRCGVMNIWEPPPSVCGRYDPAFHCKDCGDIFGCCQTPPNLCECIEPNLYMDEWVCP